MQGLEFLSLQNVGCSVHACKALSELVPAGSALAGLHLYNNMTGDEGAEHVARLLSRCPSMNELKLASSRVGPAGGISIAKALSVGGCCGWPAAASWGFVPHRKLAQVAAVMCRAGASFTSALFSCVPRPQATMGVLMITFKSLE